MSKQNITYNRTKQQNTILDLEEKYMQMIKNIITSQTFIKDLKKIELRTQEYYDTLQEIWGKKNKIKEASERLLRYHIYNYFNNIVSFYPTPISCDVALELNDVILNVDVKTIDKVGNSGELNSTQFEHNQTSFLNKSIDANGSFPGFKLKANLQTADSYTKKPIISYLVKICYADDGKGIFNILNDPNYPTLVLTCLPNGLLSTLFDNDLFLNFKDYVYYKASDGNYYKPKVITTTDDYNSLSIESKFIKIENQTHIPNTWEKIIGNTKLGYFDTEKEQLWYTVSRKVGNHKNINLEAVKFGNTARFNDTWLTNRYNSKNNSWLGIEKIYKLFDVLEDII